jgi:glycogen debranching enzyme
MNSTIIRKFLLAAILLINFNCLAQSNTELAEKILNDNRFDIIKEKGLALLSTGFNAGTGYQEVWIRDLNTFIVYSLEALPQEEVREALLKFLYFQGFDGNIIDGYQQISENELIDYYGRYTRYDMPGYAFHKNTVETDQETSLIQAFYKYVKHTTDSSILYENINGIQVIDRLDFALNFLMKHRYNSTYGLIWGATTADWGDVQPGHPWGVKLDEFSFPAIDIYDNAMLLIALDNYISLVNDKGRTKKWKKIYKEVKINIRTHLWDEENQKFRPHVYINAKAFPQLEDENKIFYHGGTAVAIQADLLNKQEVLNSLDKMKQNVKDANAQSIGLTLYPVYPENSFMNKGMVPYGYQNGGDWTWFGARMITALAQYGFVKEAYQELEPMIDRVIANDGFYEWYTVDGRPTGSGEFRGSAGVLMEAIDALIYWAETNK